MSFDRNAERKKIFDKVAYEKGRTKVGSGAWYWAFTALQWLSPICAGTVSVMVGSTATSQPAANAATSQYVPGWLILAFSVTATVLALLVSTINPEKRFIRIAIVGERLQWFERNFDLEMFIKEQECKNGADPDVIMAKWFVAKNDQLTAIVEAWQSDTDLPPLASLGRTAQTPAQEAPRQQ